jgi:hypothetical protein
VFHVIDVVNIARNNTMNASRITSHRLISQASCVCFWLHNRYLWSSNAIEEIH